MMRFDWHTGHRPGYSDRSGGGRVSGLVLRGAPGCQAGILLFGRHGSGEHEGVW